MSTVKTVEAKLHEIIQPLLEQGYYLANYGFRIRDGRLANAHQPDSDGAICVNSALGLAGFDYEVLGLNYTTMYRVEAGFEGWSRHHTHDKWFKLGERIRETYGA